ncbi:YggS family pyridoxal phosphate-dependent enzyme [Methylocaldum sp.]|uniref:YggS family pyridoxal phosphate-dependent enzyme n=1 Tax=Methylocaldum sp. TaxID=1969727 RepID=UPI002D22E4DB|nr:YggS family pyridoxal phosphate-dependent enzyme [Methylocaldum sp.]HYE34394.1 YggS family pyridoxal phosphate-dependent enzyme [Methylocaldum sp.]
MRNQIQQRLGAVRQRIRLAETAAGRCQGAVRLIAVSKTQPMEALVAAYRCGQREFGESYVQEALAKQEKLAHYDIGWHFIGPIQSNKTKVIAARFSWVHSVDRFKIAKRLSDQRPGELPPLNICIQVNVSGEATKSGVALEELKGLVEAVAELPRLRVRGLMTIPAPTDAIEFQRAPFRSLREAAECLGDIEFDTLSMGMSDDLEAAVMEGATMVRIGSALFGPRPRQNPEVFDIDGASDR